MSRHSKDGSYGRRRFVLPRSVPGLEQTLRLRGRGGNQTKFRLLAQYLERTLERAPTLSEAVLETGTPVVVERLAEFVIGAGIGGTLSAAGRQRQPLRAVYRPRRLGAFGGTRQSTNARNRQATWCRASALASRSMGPHTSVVDLERFLGLSVAVVAIEVVWFPRLAIMSVVLLPPSRSRLHVPRRNGRLFREPDCRETGVRRVH